MNQSERLQYLIKELIKEDNKYEGIPIPDSFQEQAQLLRSLMNVRMPKSISEDFLEMQDEFLSGMSEERGITSLKNIPTIADEFPESTLLYKDIISLWQGDITLLEIDAIVNAANSQMLGCFVPCHGCIDNAIHSAAGIQLRDECFQIMERQGHAEETGKAKTTRAYNLPCQFIIHTVGPIVSGKLTRQLEEDLRSCYRESLACALENGIKTLAFCCISTGEYHFPNDRAAEIAIATVTEFLKENPNRLDRIVFNVFKDLDYEIYKKSILDS